MVGEKKGVRGGEAMWTVLEAWLGAWPGTGCNFRVSGGFVEAGLVGAARQRDRSSLKRVCSG